jgi:predicted DNA-binding WGR domain protein
MATKLLTRNYINNAALFANSVTHTDNDAMHNTLPIDNVKLLSKSLVARSKDATTLSITGQLAQAELVDSFIICGHNLTVGCQYQLSLYSDFAQANQVWSTGGYVAITSDTIGADIYYDISYLPIYFDEVNAASFKLVLVNSTSDPLNYFQIYRLCFGNSVAPSIGAALQHKLTYNDQSKQYRTESGTLRTDIIKKNKQIEFNLNNIVESERAELLRTLARVGKQEEFFISTFASSCDSDKDKEYRGLVKIKRVPRYTEYANGIYNTKVVVEEV